MKHKWLLIPLVLVLLGVALIILKPKYVSKILNLDNSKKHVKTTQLKLDDETKKVTYSARRVTIIVELNVFTSYLESFIGEHGIYDDKELLQYVKESSKDNNTLNLSKLSRNLRSRAEYALAHLMQEGKCSIYNDVTNLYVKQIIVEVYGGSCGPSCGSGGRNFILPDENFIFFQTQDWIS